MYNTSSCYRSGWLRNNTIILQRKSKVNIIHAKKTHLRVSLLQRRMAVLSKQPFWINASFRDTHLIPGGKLPRWTRRTWWVPRKERNEQICEVTSYHQRRKVARWKLISFLDESIALDEIYQIYVLVDRIHM